MTASPIPTRAFDLYCAANSPGAHDAPTPSSGAFSSRQSRNIHVLPDVAASTGGRLVSRCAPTFHSAWGRIGDAMRAAISRNSGFVLDPQSPRCGQALTDQHRGQFE